MLPYDDDQAVDTQQPSEGMNTLQEMDQSEAPQEPQVAIQNNRQQQQERNFRQIREKMEQLQRERDEAIRYANEKRQREEQEDLELNIAPDEIMEGKHAVKLQRQLKKYEENFREQQNKMEALMIESRLRSSYPDFDNVVSKENLEVLSEKYPEIAQTIHSSPDLYNKAASAYTILKNLGIAGNPPAGYYQKEKEAAQRNAAKPKPLAAISPQQGSTPLSQVNDFGDELTDSVKKAYWQEMQQIMKRPR